MNRITFPKACCSCQHYTPIGFKDDEHCPHAYKNCLGKETGKKTRTRFGRCKLNKANVFMTEICASYKQEECINVVPVQNRPEPLETHQVKLEF